MSYPVTRTPEEGHTAACLAKAMIAAVENIRDAAVGDAARMGQPFFGDYDFRLQMQDNMALQAADGYLADGITECICPVPS